MACADGQSDSDEGHGLDIAGRFTRIQLAGVRIVTVSEGDVSPLHIRLKGTMSALFPKDLADRTWRGQRGPDRTGQGRRRLCFGDGVVRSAGGERRINQAEAHVVRRIFRDYEAGLSSRAIAVAFNAEGIPGTLRRARGPTTSHGNIERRNGILDNELYIARLVWNRQCFLKDPGTGKHVARPNLESNWVIPEVAELRFVDDAIWSAVRARQASLCFAKRKAGSNAPVSRWRPKHLFAGLARCSCGGDTLISKDLPGCSLARDKGTCSDRRLLPRMCRDRGRSSRPDLAKTGRKFPVERPRIPLIH